MTPQFVGRVVVAHMTRVHVLQWLPGVPRGARVHRADLGNAATRAGALASYANIAHMIVCEFAPHVRVFRVFAPHGRVFHTLPYSWCRDVGVPTFTVQRERGAQIAGGNRGTLCTVLPRRRVCVVSTAHN